MNVYIYDEFLNKSRYHRTLSKIEIRLTDLGLNGRIIRLGAIKNIAEVIQSEIKNGTRNIIAVGNNETVNKVISAIIADKTYGFFQKDLLFSIIPIGGNNSIAESFGIKKEEEACNIILARRIKQIDIALANNNIFINKAQIDADKSTISIDNTYEIELNKKMQLKIVNLDEGLPSAYSQRINPYDNMLNVIADNKNNDNTFISSADIKISGAGNIILDESVLVPLPAEIGIIKEKINVIVGKDRAFN